MGLEINDQIFGLIKFEPYIKVIIDTPEFQRLRWIWQLGLVPFVYPTANHTRFEHSLGTFYLASKLIRKLHKQLEEENINEISITDLDIYAVEIAALCHDIGHGPFSHFWDNTVIHRLSKLQFTGVKDVTHEEISKEIWKLLLKNNPQVAVVFNDYGINEDIQDRVYRLILGEMDPLLDNNKDIIFQIVSNSISGMDVDKLDYLARDLCNLGYPTGDNKDEIERLLQFNRAIKSKCGKWEIAFSDKEHYEVLRVFQTRNYLHRKAYKHKTAKAVEEMMFDGLKDCLEKNIGINYENVTDPKWISSNTDHIFWNLYNLSGNDVFKRILTRDLYQLKFSAHKKSCECVDLESVVQYFKTRIPEIECELYRVSLSRFSLGNNTFDPLSEIHFYDKNNSEIENCSFTKFSGKVCEECKLTEIDVFFIDIISEKDEENFRRHFIDWCSKNSFTLCK